jgi:integrase
VQCKTDSATHCGSVHIKKRKDEVKRSTLNKDLRNLKAFINWCRENRCLNGEIKIKLLKEDERSVKSLNTAQIKKLLLLSRCYPSMRMRILLALGTGLRRGDIESLKISDTDFVNGCVTTKSKKTRKSMGSRPVPIPVMEELKKYVPGLDREQEQLFCDNFSQCRWDTSNSVSDYVPTWISSFFRVNQKVLPVPTSDSTQILPSWFSMIFLTRVRPIPVLS